MTQSNFSLSPDLMLAILSMDSYNREYGAGLAVNTTRVGNADFQNCRQSHASEAEYMHWQETGFYAASCLLDGKTVIACRGTDNPSLFKDGRLGGSDLLTGWTTGAG